MKVINLSEKNTVLNQYLVELRDINIQGDRAKFRNNLVRIGHTDTAGCGSCADIRQ